MIELISDKKFISFTELDDLLFKLNKKFNDQIFLTRTFEDIENRSKNFMIQNSANIRHLNNIYKELYNYIESFKSFKINKRKIYLFSISVHNGLDYLDYESILFNCGIDLYNLLINKLDKNFTLSNSFYNRHNILEELLEIGYINE